MYQFMKWLKWFMFIQLGYTASKMQVYDGQDL